MTDQLAVALFAAADFGAGAAGVYAFHGDRRFRWLLPLAYAHVIGAAGCGVFLIGRSLL